MKTVWVTKTLIQGTQHLNLTTVRNQMYKEEMVQQEGTRMRLILDLSGLPKNKVVNYINPASHFAGIVNTALRLKGVTPWPGTTTLATSPNATTIQIDWVKGGIFVEIILAAVLGAVVYWAITHWSMQSITSHIVGSASTPSGSATGGTSVLGTVNWVAWAAVLVGGFALAKQFLVDKDDGKLV